MIGPIRKYLSRQPHFTTFAPRKAKFVSYDRQSKVVTVDFGLDGARLPFNATWLRDACPGDCCIDWSTTQKRFRFSDIPQDLGISAVQDLPHYKGFKITWKNDVLHPDHGKEHKSVYTTEFFAKLAITSTYPNLWRGDGMNSVIWNRESLDMLKVPYLRFMEDDLMLHKALLRLVRDGIIMIKKAPQNRHIVEKIALRIGNLRDTLYGRTWDVKSIPNAKNVAYTSIHLGLHMDLLYMKDPPGLQFLHCLRNTCKGGTALFSDSFNAVKALWMEDVATLCTFKTAYQYRNNNEHYYHEHKTIEFEDMHSVTPKYVNWSPPFQAPYNIPIPKQSKRPQERFLRLQKATKNFADIIEAPENLYRYDYEEGDCVIFNNRRVLHGREAFQMQGGERWLRGAYIDTDVFESRLRVLHEKFMPASVVSLSQR